MNDKQMARKHERVPCLALIGQHAFAMFNLGIVHAYGYGGLHPTLQLSHDWLVQTGLPESLYLASRQVQTLPVALDPCEVVIQEQALLRRARKSRMGLTAIICHCGIYGCRLGDVFP